VASDMNYFYNVVIPHDERSRVELLEPFDEYEEWHLKCAHYVLLTAFNGSCQRLTPLMWPQSSTCAAEIDGDIFNWKSNRSTDDSCGTFVAMAKRSPTSGSGDPVVSWNICEVEEPSSSDGVASASFETEQNQSSVLQDVMSRPSLCAATLCRHSSHWKAAELTFIGDETDSRCQRFGHTANVLVINGQRHLVAVGGFGVAPCGRHRRLSDVTAWNLSAMTPDTYSIDGGGLLSWMCHATVTLGNSVLGNTTPGNSSLVIVGGRHSPASPVREHIVSVDFGNSLSANSITCHAVVCSGDIPDSCWRHTVVHAIIDGVLLTSDYCNSYRTFHSTGLHACVAAVVQ